MKNKIKIALIFSILSLIFVSQSYARSCYRLGKNSCWHAINNGQYKVIFECRLENGGSFSTPKLSNGEIFSIQFDKGYGDGMGYPEPTGVHCMANAEGKVRRLFFHTGQWGRPVQLELTNDHYFKIKLFPVWGSEGQEFISEGPF